MKQQYEVFASIIILANDESEAMELAEKEMKAKGFISSADESYQTMVNVKENSFALVDVKPLMYN